MWVQTIVWLLFGSPWIKRIKTEKTIMVERKEGDLHFEHSTHTHTHSLTTQREKRMCMHHIYMLNQNWGCPELRFCYLQQKMEVRSLAKKRRWIHIGYIDILERLWYLIHGERYAAILIICISCYFFLEFYALEIDTWNPHRARKYCLVC